jgi:hypothetical protein
VTDSLAAQGLQLKGFRSTKLGCARIVQINAIFLSTVSMHTFLFPSIWLAFERTAATPRSSIPSSRP